MAARIGYVSLHNPAATIRRVSKKKSRIVSAVRRCIVSQRLFDHAATRIVLIGQIEDPTRILDREHSMRRVVSVFSDSVVWISDLPESPACIIGVTNGAADIVCRLGAASTRIISKLNPAVVRCRDLSEFLIDVPVKLQNVAVAIRDS